MTETMPLVSVIMPSFNQRGFIAEALDSVFSQDYPSVEVFVADGASTDGTPAYLAERSARDPRLRWLSEPDTGPAQALNRALSKARGTVIGWLNSDDMYTSGAISRAVAAFEANPEWLMAYGHGEHVDIDGKLIAPYPTQKPEGPLERFADGCFICQPTAFFLRSLPVLIGPIDESFRASFDFDYWVRAFSAFPERIGFVDAVQAKSRLHEGGITARQRRDVAIEGMRIATCICGHAPSHWFSTYCEEMMALPEDKRPADLKAHMLETFEECAKYLDEADISKMCRAIESYTIAQLQSVDAESSRS